MIQGQLVISNEVGKSSSISKEWDKQKLALVQYLHLSRHLIDVIYFVIKNCSMQKVVSTPDYLVRKPTLQRLRRSPVCQGQREEQIWIQAAPFPAWDLFTVLIRALDAQRGEYALGSTSLLQIWAQRWKGVESEAAGAHPATVMHGTRRWSWMGLSAIASHGPSRKEDMNSIQLL